MSCIITFVVENYWSIFAYILTNSTDYFTAYRVSQLKEIKIPRTTIKNGLKKINRFPVLYPGRQINNKTCNLK